MPIYNAGKYIDKAIGSVREQTLKNIEIICINDGSTDNSLEIIKRHATEDKRIKIIDKTNSGYGDSMNRGLTAATGAYIAILEPDDWIEPNMYKELYKIAQANDSDVVKSNCWKYKEATDNNDLWHLISDDKSGATICPINDQFIFSCPPSIWSAIYKRKFLIRNSIDFLTTPGASYQDTSFSFKVWAMADKVSLTDKAYLHYRIDNASSSINNVDKKADYIIHEYNEIKSYLIKHGTWNALYSCYNYCKFLAYEWNIEYLSPHKMIRFISNTSPDFLQFLNKVDIDNKLSFLSNKQRHNIYLWAKHPRLFAADKLVRKKIHAILGR